MAAKKDMTRVSTTGRTTAEKLPGKVATKKRAKKKAKPAKMPEGITLQLVEQVRERIRAMVGDLELEVLFSNPGKVADVMGQFFLHLMGSDITGDWDRHGE